MLYYIRKEIKVGESRLKASIWLLSFPLHSTLLNLLLSLWLNWLALLLKLRRPDSFSFAAAARLFIRNNSSYSAVVNNMMKSQRSFMTPAIIHNISSIKTICTTVTRVVVPIMLNRSDPIWYFEEQEQKDLGKWDEMNILTCSVISEGDVESI